MLYRHGEKSRMWRHCSMAAPADVPGFEDQRFQAAFEQVGRGGQADRAGADHGDGKVLG